MYQRLGRKITQGERRQLVRLGATAALLRRRARRYSTDILRMGETAKQSADADAMLRRFIDQLGKKHGIKGRFGINFVTGEFVLKELSLDEVVKAEKAAANEPKN